MEVLNATSNGNLKTKQDIMAEEFKGDVWVGDMLPVCHANKACHHQSLRKKGLLKDLKFLIGKLEQLPSCNQWEQENKYLPNKGPFTFGVYRSRGKPWDCCRVKSRELIGSKLIKYCDCVKRNGLQDDCERSQCRGRKWCMYHPLPKCPPFTLTPALHQDQDPYDACPEKLWKESPDYPAYQKMMKTSKERFVEGCDFGQSS